MNYQLLDSGDEKKWEQFGPYVLERPCPQAVWKPQKQEEAQARFSRKEGWVLGQNFPDYWVVEMEGIQLKVSLTDFGHIGVFPEHQFFWRHLKRFLKEGDRFLNLFAYSGAASLIAAKQGASVCHVDAAKGMVEWAKENASLNGLEKAPIRWIVEDAIKFMKREVRRGHQYDAILLDPPSFGRGSKGEVFKIEQEIHLLLDLSKDLLREGGSLLFSCHTLGWTPLVLEQLLKQRFHQTIQAEEMRLLSEGGYAIPSGSAAWCS